MEATKELKDLSIGQKLIRLSDMRAYTLSDIFNDSEDDDFSSSKPSKYFYFSEIGSSVKDKVMKKMFKTYDNRFIIL